MLLLYDDRVTELWKSALMFSCFGMDIETDLWTRSNNGLINVGVRVFCGDVRK